MQGKQQNRFVTRQIDHPLVHDQFHIPDHRRTVFALVNIKVYPDNGIRPDVVGYAGKPAEQTLKRCHYIPHVRQRGEETRTAKHGRRHPARRWVVERTHSWLNRFRKLLVRFEKLAESYEALLEIACALIVFRQCFVIHG